MPNTISSMRQVTIAGVLPPRLMKRCKVAFNLLASHRQQRPNQAFFTLPRRDTRKSARTGAAYNPHQNGLRLIVQGVSSSDLLCSALANETREPLVTQIPRRSFQTEFVFLR